MDRAHPTESPQNQAACAPLDGLTPCNAAPLSSPAAASQATNPNAYPDAAPRSPTPYRDTLLKSLHAQDSPATPTTVSLPARATAPPPSVFPLSKASLKLRCYRCLSKKHKVQACRDPVRCARCGNFGHRSANCDPKNTPLALALPPFSSSPQSDNFNPPMASPSAPSPFADDGSVIVAAPNGDLWLGARRFNLHPRSPYNIHNQPGQRANPINNYSEGEDDDDDDSAPPSQRGSATNNDPLPDAAFDAARGILRGTPVARRAPANRAARLGGPVPEIFVPQHFIHDVSNLAYALIDGQVRQEMTHIRDALEANPRCPPFVLAPSAFGSALLIFPSNADRNRAMALGPYTLDGATVNIVPPEAGEDIATTNYDVIVEMRARKYPLRLWHPAGANFIFGSIGKLCCVDQCSVTGQDFTVIRAFVLLERGKRVPPSVVLCMPNNDVIIVYFDVDNSWHLDVTADAPPPPPPSPQAHTVPSMASIQNDHSFTFAAQSSDQGALPSPLPVNETPSSLAPPQHLNLPASDDAENFIHTPDPFHAREDQRRRTRARRATEAAAKVRRSQRLAAKQEAIFVSMLEVAVKKKATSFDLSAASPSLAAALADTGLVDAPDLPASDVHAVCAVARECGATEEELTALDDLPVPPSAP
ncbi:hypothetical protein ACQ4PT_001207 [Festuca glaucescens]